MTPLTALPEESTALAASESSWTLSRSEPEISPLTLTAATPETTLEAPETSIWDSELEISTTQRIMKTVTNLLTGERISTETGNVKRSIARRQPFSNTVTTEQSAAQKQLDALTEQVSDIDFATTVPTPITTAAGAYLTTTGGKYLLYKKG